MNERIKQLMGQTLDEKFAGTWSVMDMQDLTKFADRFAELIVAHATECVRDVLREEDSELTYTAAAQVQNRIKEFFGVEE
jgi:hypothetical protein